MDPIPYAAIAANIAQVDVDGAQVKVRWKCADSGREMGQSSATMAPDPSLAGRVKANVKRSIASELIYGAARALSGLLGGAAGRVVSNAVYTAAGELNTRATAGVDYGEASRQAAIVVAFESVQAGFVWDEKRRHYVARESSAA